MILRPSGVLSAHSDQQGRQQLDFASEWPPFTVWLAAGHHQFI
jgi:hypothetical protein